MRYNILHIILTLSIALLALQSCGLEEPVIGGINGGTGVEVVFRSTSYNGVTVKATNNADPLQIENKIHRAEMLVFDNNGKRTIRKTLTTSNGALTNQSATFTSDPLFNNGTVCFIANVPSDFVDTWSQKLDTETSYTSDLDKLHSAVIDFNATGSKFSYASNTDCIGVPQVELTAGSDPVKCFPMYGEISLANRSNNQVTIDIKRLFAKVEVVVSIGTAVTKFTMSNYTVHNLPTKVGLCEPATGGESPCAQSTNTGDFLASNNSKSSFNLVGASSGNVVKTGTKSFYFYMPEHVLGGDKTNTEITNPTQSDKPNIIGASYKPTYVSIVGEVIANGDNNIVNFCDHTYNIYLGGNVINNYDVSRNNRYENNVTINGITADHRIPNPVVVPYTNLVNGEAANCYIITTGNTNYLLPTYKGATKTLTESNMAYGFPEVIWNDNPENVIELINEDKADRQITFKVTNATIKPGNALLAIKDPDSQDILWSWHLWFCAGSAPSDQYYAANTYLMDRSLGAKEAADMDLSFLSFINNVAPGQIPDALRFFYKDGLFYQRGRKDPLKKPSLTEYNFVNQDEITEADLSQNLGGSLDNTNSNPWAFDKGWSFASSWTPQNNTKSTYDPCPAGYRVPSSSVWTKKQEDFSRLNSNESTFIYTKIEDISINNWQNATLITYPYTGYLNENGGWDQGDIGAGNANDTFTGEVPYPALVSNKYFSAGQGGLGAYKNTDPKPRKFTNIEYSLVDKEVNGLLFATENQDKKENKIVYGYKDQGFLIHRYSINEGSWENVTTGFGIFQVTIYHKAKYDESKWTDCTTEEDDEGVYRKLSSEELEAIGNAIEAKITQDNILSGGFAGILGNLFDNITNSLSSNAVFRKETDTSKAAYNIRCIKEVAQQ